MTNDTADLLGHLARAVDRARDERREAVHWVGDAPTSLHGNGAASFVHTTRDPREVTCRLCLHILAADEREAGE